MKKRILCLLLAILAVLSCALVGCAGTDDDPTDEELNSNVNTARAPKTLNMWIVTEDETTEAAQKRVEAAFNAYTETTYTTHVNLIFCKKDEYEAKLNAQFALTDSRPGNHSFKQSTEITTTIDPETGMTMMVYPTPSQYQVDIVLITGQEMLTNYITQDYDSTNKKGRLEPLNTSLLNASKIIQSYVYNDVLDGSSIGGNIYAIPNNNVIGEFTYLLINKEMADKYYYTASDFTTFGDVDGLGNQLPVSKLIDLIAENEDRSKIAPMLGMAEYPMVEYWGKNGAFSLLGTFYDYPNSTLGALAGVTTVFGDRNYNNYMSLMYKCKENGYFLNGTEETFGVGVVAGDYSLMSQYYEDFYIQILDYPHLNDEQIFDSMFAVTKYTTDIDRSMEIITELTCKTELRNILQYGIEGEHYDFDDDGYVVRNTKDAENIYKMDVNYTGNILMAYPEAGMHPEHWHELVKLQNRNSLPSLLMTSFQSLVQVDKVAMEQMIAVSNSYLERMKNCETLMEFQEFAKAANTEISTSSYYQILMNERNPDNTFDMESLKGAVTKWYRDMMGIKDDE